MFTCERWPLLTARRRSASAEPNRGGRVCRPGLTVANCSPTVESAATSRFSPLHWHGLLALESSARRSMPHTGSRGLASARRLLPELKT